MGNSAIWSTDRGHGTGPSQQVPQIERMRFPYLQPQLTPSFSVSWAALAGGCAIVQGTGWLGLATPVTPWTWQVLCLSYMCFVQSFKSPLNFHWLEVAELKPELCPGFDQQIEAQVLLWLKGTPINLAWEICRTYFCQEAWSACCFILGHNVMSHFL